MAQATVAATVTGLQGRPMLATAPTANQALGWNGTNWLPQGPYLPTAGGTITGNLSTSGSLNGGSIQTPGSAGVLLNGQGVNLLAGRGYNGVNFLSSQYAFSGTTSLAGGANLQVTTHTTGLCLVCATCQLGAGSANSGVLAGLFFGTGTPPAQGAAAGANSIGYGLTWAGNGNTAGAWVPWTVSIPYGGFTPGTTYWFDIGFSISNNVGTGYAAWGNLWVTEF